MTQLENIREALAKLLHDPMDARAFSQLDEALDAAQNRPEYGGCADGSVSEEDWRAAAHLREAFDKVRTYAPRLSGGGR